MVDVLEHGRRPRLLSADPRAGGGDAMRACPGIELHHEFDPANPALIAELMPGWGPVLELWEGHASDADIRFAGSSGGAASALALYCIERGGMHGLLHTAARVDVPYLNQTVMSTTRQQILSAAGSRYAPASPCDSLEQVETAPGPCVFVAKPCDVAGAEKARRLRPGLDRNLGLTVAVFCAGTPSTKGTLEMMQRMGFDDPTAVTSVRYRGMGWPGKATVEGRSNGHARREQFTYDQSWNQILQRHRQWRCYICPDHTGEFADIAVGDPWYREIGPDEPGRSLVVVRTERGRRILRDAMAAGYLTLERVGADILPRSQPNLLRTRGALWGRLAALRMMLVPAPRFGGMPTFRFWCSQLTLKAKAQSVLGTIKRVFRRGLNKRAAMEEYLPPVPATPPTARADGGGEACAAST